MYLHCLSVLLSFFFAFVCYSGVNTYCVVFLYCFSSSGVPYVASFSGLSIFYCPFGILLPLFPLIKIHTNIICETIANSYWYTSSNTCSFLQTTHIKKHQESNSIYTITIVVFLQNVSTMCIIYFA